jgi:hypothetical protein
VRRRLDLDNTDWFYIITLQRLSAGKYFSNGHDKLSVSIKLQANFISTNTVGKNNGNMENLLLVNEEDGEPWKADVEFKEASITPTGHAELYTIPPLFKTNKKWKQLLDEDFPSYSGNNCGQQYIKGF